MKQTNGMQSLKKLTNKIKQRLTKINLRNYWIYQNKKLKRKKNKLEVKVKARLKLKNK
jgi:hypothetical protein